MKKKRKRIFALLLAVLLCISSMQVMATESGETSGDNSGQETETQPDGGDTSGESSDTHGGTPDTNTPENPDGQIGTEPSDSVPDSPTENENSGENNNPEADSLAQEPLTLAEARAGSEALITNMPEGELLFLTLVDNTDYRWNVNGSGSKTNVVHLDDVEGNNCTFRLSKVENEWYGIKFIKNAGTDRYVDIDEKSPNEGAVLHIWEDSDSKVKDNPHRQFAFYDAGTDDAGNQMYYIKNRNSNLWVGMEGDKIATHQKLVQTSKRRKWYVTPCVVPKSGKELNLWEKNSKVYCEIFEKDTMEAINILWKEGMKETNGMLLNTYVLGQNSRWILKWSSKYEAYEIESVNQSTLGANPTDHVWDVQGESGGDALLNLWDRQSKDKNYNTSQLWRFIGSDAGNVKLQNARSGKYVVIKDADYLKQGSNGDSFEVSLISHDAKNSESCQTDLDTEATTWMSKIPDGALLSSVNMPGTHDTGTAAIIQDMALGLGGLSFTQCQKYYFEEQLDVGTRSFDIRCNAPSDTSTADQVKIIHGGKVWQCFDQWGNDLSLEWILDNAKQFLAKHKSEAIVFMVKPDDGSTKGLTHALAEYMKSNKDLFWHSDSVPTMKEARGKIVLVSRFKVDSSSYTQTSDGAPAVSWFGPQLDNWDDYKYGNTAGLLEIHQNPGCYAQDAYNEGRYSKKEYIEGAMRDSTSGKIPGNAYIWNYTSSAMLLPLKTTRSINPWLYEDEMNLIDNRRLGMVMLNFIDITTSRLIYATNTNGNFFTPKCTFPDGLSVTYGDLMTEAEWEGGSGDGIFSIDDSQIGYYPTRDDVGKHVPMVFTPNDSRLIPVKQNVDMKELKPKEISVEIPAQTVEYGETVSLTCNIPEGELVGDDTKESLNIKLSLKGAGENDRLPVGTYTIDGSFDNENYAVTFTGTKNLTVTPRQLNANWSDTTNIVYGMVDGKTDLDAWEKTGANVTASLEGILDGDDCKAEITGGNKTDPSWNDIDTAPKKYTAEITELTGKDAKNYAIPANNTKDYYIRRADADDYCLPDSATVIYGEPLSKATLTGASGDGNFIFFKTNDSNVENAMNEKPGGVGDYTYWIWYHPADSDTVKGTGKAITVKVLPKPVTVNALDASKTYGDCSPTYNFDTAQAEEQMANGETADELNLTLTAGDGDNLTAPVGTYPITRADCTNNNYDVTVIPADLKITRRQAELSWSNFDTRTYDGNASDVTASVTNLAHDESGKPDTCTVTVLGSKQTNAGTYSAVAVKLSNPNYQLKAGNLSQSYTIEKATPTVTWPAATLTYGQTLCESTLTGGFATGVKGDALEGVFQFQSDCATVIPTVVESSTESYPMEFIPSDTRNYNSTLNTDFKATVEKKPLQVEMLDTEKVYGDPLTSADLAIYYKESEIVETDTIKVLPVVQEGGIDIDPSYANAGEYIITAEQSQLDTDNPNYAITIRDGRLTVKKRPVILKWSDTTNIVYGMVDGNLDLDAWEKTGANVTATVSNLVKQQDGTFDDCTVTVEGGNATEPSANGADSDKRYTVYYAIAKELKGTSSPNYTFTEEEPAPPTNPLDDQTIYENNRIMPYVIRQAEDCIMPLGAVLTYGQTFGDAHMLAGSGNGTFHITDEKGNDVTNQTPDAGIYQDTYKVTFTPKNSSPIPSVGKFFVIVRKAPIRVTARDTEKTYGEGKPAYEFDISTDPGLVNGDTVEELLTVKSVIYEYEDENSDEPTGEISGDKKDSNADTYQIVLDKQENDNYDLTFIEGTLIVHPLEVKIKWSDTSDIVYSYVDGKKDLEKWNQTGANVTASAANLINDDTCNLTCVGGDQKNAGEYYALVTGLDNPNYRLPVSRSSKNLSDSEQVKEYTIKKATPDTVFPDKLIAQKGDVLGGLPYKATADTAGVFAFENPDTVLEKPGNYTMIFTPDDTRNYNTVNGTVYVELSENVGQSGKTGSAGKGSVSTSDNNPVWLYLILLLLSGLTEIALLRRRRK